MTGAVHTLAQTNTCTLAHRSVGATPPITVDRSTPWAWQEGINFNKTCTECVHDLC